MYIITNSSLCCFVIPVVSAITLFRPTSRIIIFYFFCFVVVVLLGFFCVVVLFSFFVGILGVKGSVGSVCMYVCMYVCICINYICMYK